MSANRRRSVQRGGPDAGDGLQLRGGRGEDPVGGQRHAAERRRPDGAALRLVRDPTPP